MNETVERITTKPVAHTPGPWSVADDHPNRACLHIRAETGEVAHLFGAPGDDTEHSEQGVWRGDTFRIANANLIAAAPDLLAACKKVKSGVNAMTCEDFDQLNAAVAKAEGGAR